MANLGAAKVGSAPCRLLVVVADGGRREVGATDRPSGTAPWDVLHVDCPRNVGVYRCGHGRAEVS